MKTVLVIIKWTLVQYVITDVHYDDYNLGNSLNTFYFDS